MIGCFFQAISILAGSLLFVGSPMQNFHAPLGEPLTLLRNTALDETTARSTRIYCICYGSVGAF